MMEMTRYVTQRDNCLNVSQFTRQSQAQAGDIDQELDIICQHFHGVSMGGSSTWDKVEVEQEDSRPEEVDLLPSNCQLGG